MSERPRSGLARRLAERRARYRERHPAYRAAVTAAGFLVTAAGVAMLALPGPALVVIPAGLAMLALQFTWAERLLERALERAEAARHSAAEASPARKALLAGAGALVAGGAVAAALLWDVPLLPV